MSLAHILDALDHIATHETRLRQHLPELSRRARISSRRDGYPSRASGAQPGTVTTTRESYTLSTRLLSVDGTLWTWECSCGTTGHQHFPWQTSWAALAAGQTHHESAHGTSTAIDYSDPSGEAAIADNRPDLVSRRYQRATREIEKACRALEIAVAQLAEPTDVEEGGPWCASCSRIRHDDGTPHLSPLRTGLKGATDVAGRLKDPMPLCRFCWDYVAAEGNIPPRAFIGEYLTKGRAPRRTA